MQLEELEKRTSQLQMEADGLVKAQQALYVCRVIYKLTVFTSESTAAVCHDFIRISV